MDVRDFAFDLPAEQIAQEPVARGSARLMCLDRSGGRLQHASIPDLLSKLHAGDVLVLNNSRVFPARLLGRRLPGGGAVECLLTEQLPLESNAAEPRFSSAAGVDANPVSSTASAGVDPDAAQLWEALMHPGQRLRPGSRVVFDGVPAVFGEVLARKFHGRRLVRLWTEDGSSMSCAIDRIGHVPLPPYIRRGDGPPDADCYQTVFARERGSVAAPTAGLHFTRALLDALSARGVAVVELTLHVGYGTFQPVRVERVEDHRLEPERYHLDENAARAINHALDERRRVMAVGTTTTRVLEAVGRDHEGRVAAQRGTTDLFIHPGFEFRIVSGLLTNFHLPCSSLLMLVAAFAGRDQVLRAYRTAIADGYRFYSYGDAMLIS